MKELIEGEVFIDLSNYCETSYPQVEEVSGDEGSMEGSIEDSIEDSSEA